MMNTIHFSPKINWEINHRRRPLESGLPMDLLRLIISLVPAQEQKSIYSVCQNWKFAYLEYVSEPQVKLLNAVKTFFALDIKLPNLSFSGDLSALSSCLIEARSRMADKLRNGPFDETAYALIKKPVHFEGLLDLLKLDEKFKNKEFQGLVKHYISLGALDRAYAVYQAMEDGDSALLSLFETTRDEMLVRLMKLQETKITAFTKYMLWKNVDQAIAIAHSLEEGFQKTAVLMAIPLMKLIVEGDYSELLTMEKTPFTPESRFFFEFLKEAILTNIIKEGNFKSIREQVLQMVTIKNDILLMNMLETVTNEGVLDVHYEGLRIEHKDLILKIVRTLCSNGKINQSEFFAAQVACVSPLGLDRLLAGIINAFEDVEKGDFQHIMDVCQMCADHQIDEPLEYSATKLLGVGRRDDALKVALMISDLPVKYKTLKMIRNTVV